MIDNGGGGTASSISAVCAEIYEVTVLAAARNRCSMRMNCDKIGGNSGSAGKLVAPVRSQPGEFGSFFHVVVVGSGGGGAGGVGPGAGAGIGVVIQPGAPATAAIVSSDIGVAVETVSNSTVPAGAMSGPTTASARGAPVASFKRSTICEGAAAAGYSWRPSGPRRRMRRRKAGATEPAAIRVVDRCDASVASVPILTRSLVCSGRVSCRNEPAPSKTLIWRAMIDCAATRAS